MKSQFIFNLGLPRTGTTSLHVAMLLLGVPAAHRPMGLSKIFFENKIEKLLDLPFLAYSDLPIPNYYQEIHTFFPEAKFIMTVRNVESWLTSIENFYSTRPPAANGISGRDLLRIATFGMTKFHAGRFERIYRMHSESVRDYFINSKANYLELNEVAFNDWAPICNFLEVNMPDVAYPKISNPNIGKYSAVDKKSVHDAKSQLISIYNKFGDYNL